ncbi:MAG: hypothetical protein ACPIOQ_34665, partial [Promethearchaeia archaeon]
STDIRILGRYIVLAGELEPIADATPELVLQRRCIVEPDLDIPILPLVPGLVAFMATSGTCVRDAPK